MAVQYVKNGLVVRQSGGQELLDLISYQRKNYGGHFDLNAKQIAKLIKDYYKYNNVKALKNVTVDDIKEQLAKGGVIIAPVAGRLLQNPYYTPPGPLYHNLVIKGYDDRSQEFITNDPGTKRGRNYRYKYAVFFNAIHDWPGSKLAIKQGKKAIVVINSLVTVEVF